LASDHLIVVEKAADFRWAGSGSDSRVMTAEEFIAEGADDHAIRRPAAARRPRKVINLCRNYDYLSLGYYCSLLAEARGDRITPSVETILDLQQRSTQQGLLAQLDRLIDGLDEIPRSVNTLSFHVFFGRIEDPALADLARKSFELFRCPLLELALERPAGLAGWKTTSVKALDPREVDVSRDALFLGALDEFTRRRWSPARVHSLPRMDLAILHDPHDPLPPSNLATLARLVEVGEDMDISVELIRKKDFSRLTQFDALFTGPPLMKSLYPPTHS
jgi:hypothetical protein